MPGITECLIVPHEEIITTRTKLFAILCLAGMAGVLSVLLIDLSAVLANLPANAELKMPFPPVIIKLLVHPIPILRSHGFRVCGLRQLNNGFICLSCRFNQGDISRTTVALFGCRFGFRDLSGIG